MLQAHSLEDGAFKSDHIVIGPVPRSVPARSCTTGHVVHEGAVLDADAFLMKGQEVPAYTRWRGNPAAETREPLVAPPTAASAPVPRPVLIATLVLAALIALAASARRRAGPLAAAGAAGLVLVDRRRATVIR